MLYIRKYQEADTDELWELFYNTVHRVNIKDYSKSQVDAWASKDIGINNWRAILIKNQPFLAVKSGKIIGYADLQRDGLIDHFYCHYEHQGEGVGRALMGHIFAEAATQNINKLYSHVSKTAKPFFESFGFQLIVEQEVVRRGERLINYLMEQSVFNYI